MMNEDLFATYEPLVISASELIRQNKLYEAEKKIILAIKTCFDRPEAYNLLGVLNELRHEEKKALMYYRVAYTYDPTYSFANKNIHRLVEETHSQYQCFF